MNYANVWSRLAAYMIDGLIISIFNSIIGTIVMKTAGIPTLEGGIQTEEEIVSILIYSLITYFAVLTIISWLYESIQLSSSKQATIGKQIMGLVVTDMNGNGISFGKASLRFFMKFIVSGMLLIGYIMAFFTEKKQSLHDLVAGTLVLQKSS